MATRPTSTQVPGWRVLGNESFFANGLARVARCRRTIAARAPRALGGRALSPPATLSSCRIGIGLADRISRRACRRRGSRKSLVLRRRTTFPDRRRQRRTQRSRAAGERARRARNRPRDSPRANANNKRIEPRLCAKSACKRTACAVFELQAETLFRPAGTHSSRAGRAPLSSSLPFPRCPIE